MVRICYGNDQNHIYVFNQFTIDYWSGYDKEEMDYIDVKIQNQYEGILFMKNNQYTIQWQQDGYIMEIVGIQKKEESERLAASVKPVEE